MSSDLGKRLLDVARKASNQDASSPQKSTKATHDAPESTDIGMLAPGIILTATDGSKGGVPSSSSPSTAFNAVRPNDPTVFLAPDEVGQRQLPRAKPTPKSIEKQDREWKEIAGEPATNHARAEALIRRQKYLPNPVGLGTGAVKGLRQSKPNLDPDGKTTNDDKKKQSKASSAQRQADQVIVNLLLLPC